MRIAAIVHVYYAELWPELAACLRNAGDCDVFATCSDEVVVELVKADFPAANIVLCENRGFDIWPFLAVINELDICRYDYILKLHTKRDIRFPCRLHGKDMSGSRWRTSLLSLVSSKESWLRALLLMERDSSVGLVGAADCILSRRDMGRSERQSYDRALLLADAIGMPSTALRRARYIGGTMFLARARIFRRLQGRWTAQDFDVPLERHGETFAHQIERLFGFCVAAEGLRITDADDTIDGLRKRLDFASHEFVDWLKELLFQSKTTARGRHVIKILKIPVWNGRTRG